MADRTATSNQRFFIDREESMKSLYAAYEKVTETSENRLVFILGEAGIGKTSLVEQFLSRIDSKQVFVLPVRGYEEQSSPLFPFAETVKSFLSIYRVVDRKYVFDSILNLTKLVPMIEPVVGPIQEIVKDTRGLSDVDKYSISNNYIVFSNYLSLIKKIAGKRVVILNVDDAQWLDSASFELLSYLIKKSINNMLTVVSYRTGFVTSSKESDARDHLDQLLRSAPSGRHDVIELKSLSESLYPQFISGFLGPHRLRKSNMKELFGHTEGNPFFLKSTVAMLRESGAMAKDPDGLWSLAAHGSEKSQGIMPKSLQETVMRRIKRVYSDVPGCRDIISYASVIGYRFELGMLSDFLKKDKLEVHHTLQELENAFSIVRTTDRGETYVFDHRKTQEAIYNSLGTVARDCHTRIAKFLEGVYDSNDPGSNPFIIAYHYRKAGEWSKAIKFLKISAEAAFGSYFYSEALKEYEACFSVLQEHGVALSQQETDSLKLGYCKSLLGNNMISECITGVDSLLRSSSLSESQTSEAHLMLGKCYRMEGKPDSGAKAVQSVESSLRILEKLNDNADMLGEVHSYLATVYDHFGHHQKAVNAFEQSQICYNRANDNASLARLQRKSGMIFESRRAIGFMKNALQTFDKYSMKIEKARCLNNIGAESFYVADFAQAERHLGLSLELFRSLDSPEVDIPLNNLALVYQQKADYEKSLQFLEDAHDNVSEPFNDIFISMNMANIYRKTGRVEKSRQIIVHLESSVEAYHEPVMNDYYGFNRAMIHRDLGEIDEAEKWLEEFSPNDYKNDEELARAKRYNALSDILEKKSKADRSKVEELKSKSLELFKTARPQRWFYELDYYPCDIHIWD